MSNTIKRGALAAIAVSAVLSTGAFAADPLKVGWVVPLTGSFAQSGDTMTVGVQFEIDKINSEGGLLGRKLDLVTRDSASDPSKALSVTNELLFNDNVDVILGPGSSGEAFPLGDVIAGAQKMQVMPTQADPLIDPIKRPYAFRGMPALGAVAQRTVQFTSDTLKKKKVAIFADSTGYGTNISNLLKAGYEKAGIDLVGITLINTNKADVTPEVVKAKEAGADVIEIWTDASSLEARILNARGGLGWDVPVVGHTNLVGKEVEGLVDSPEYLKQVYGITYASIVYDDAGKLPPLSQALIDGLGTQLDKYTNSPLFHAEVGAGLVQIFEAGVKKANSFEADKVAAALVSMGPIDTCFGTFTYSNTDHTGYSLDSLTFVAAGSSKGYGNTKLKLQ
jgi:branched-chain amino acid transport system substrate-binding protein